MLAVKRVALQLTLAGNAMRVAVLEHQQSPADTPLHFISQTLTERFLSYFHNGKRAGVPISDKLLWIKVNVTFGKLKALLRSNAKPGVPMILPPRVPENLDLAYPEAYRQSNGAAIRRQVWRCWGT